MDLRFGVLGQLEVVGPAGPMPVGGPRPRTLLAVLLVEAGRVVGRRRLIDELWGDEPPPTAVAALQVHVAALRKLVGPALRTSGDGYVLDVRPGQVDATRFEALLREADQAADPATRSGLLWDALALWRGEAFADVPPSPSLTAAAARLGELHLGAVETRVESDLALGRHQELVPELRELVAANPGRERLAGQLMLALHRGEAAALNNLGMLAARAGDLQGVRQASLQSLAIYRRLQLAEGELDSLENLAWMEAAAGRHEAALRIVAVAERERRRLGAAVLVSDEQARHDATLSAVRAAPNAEQQAAVLAEARLVQLEEMVAGVLSGEAAPAGDAAQPAGAVRGRRP